MASLSRAEARRLVHQAGLRATAPRVAVLRLLTDSNRPLSHSEVVEAVGGEDWDQATLYRNLIKLVEAKLLRVANRIGGIARYEATRDEDEPHLHPHFACRECGSAECLPKARLTARVSPEWRVALTEAELQLIGRCPTCRAGRKVKQRSSK